MAKVRSQALVIDASIAQAAGLDTATHATAKRCRDFLLAVGDICHRMILSQAGEEEWDAHQSSFARGWRRSMFARKKIERVDVPVDEILHKQLERAARTKKQIEAMRKDAHLLEAARAKGMRIGSLDETVRDYFRNVAGAVARLREICWVNPDNPGENILEWLQAGAPPDRFRKLGHRSTEE